MLVRSVVILLKTHRSIVFRANNSFARKVGLNEGEGQPAFTGAWCLTVAESIRFNTFKKWV